jgi:hypothetical protein
MLLLLRTTSVRSVWSGIQFEREPAEASKKKEEESTSSSSSSKPKPKEEGGKKQ